MRLAAHPKLDALCGEYLLGTLRGSARRRFERALREEPRIAQRLKYWQDLFAPRYTTMMEVQPHADGWTRLERELGLARYRTPWHRRLAFWRGWAVAATIAVMAALGIALLPPTGEAPPAVEIAQLQDNAKTSRVTASATSDRRTLELHASRPIVAGSNQSYELWLLPAEGGPPLSLAVLGSLDARIPVPPAHSVRMKPGAKLAVSVEPAGGSPTGGPTGPVILVGPIEI
jgi:anti-sigma-K factor RskA